MIDYEYTKVNRLEIPHKYMYTPYKGSDFLDAYFKDRSKHLESFRNPQESQYKNKVDLFLHISCSIMSLALFNHLRLILPTTNL